MIEIRIENISPHPKNPRKNLGDLTELTDSIRTFGVLQNLTVVPDGTGGYTVICGHRRLAAAEAAGLETVPCIVAEDMDEKTQVSIMLLENMQRSDLTVQEEAQGLQMMLDLGSSIAEIVKETGLSETKVRHRVKINELDQDLLAEKLAGQININDLIKLEQIKDIETRNALLKEIGTNNFDWELQKQLSRQKRLKTEKLIKEYLPEAEFVDGYYWQYKTFGELKFGAGQNEVAEFLGELKDKEEELQESAVILVKGNAFVIGFKSGSSSAYEPDPEEERKREKRERRRSELREMADRVHESWDEFMVEYCDHKEPYFEGAMRGIISTLICNLCSDKYYDIEPDNVSNLVGAEEGDLRELLDRPYATLAALAYESGAPSGYDTTWAYSTLKYEENAARKHMQTHEYLKILGYKASDEEEAFVYGTSELYGEDEE